MAENIYWFYQYLFSIIGSNSIAETKCRGRIFKNTLSFFFYIEYRLKDYQLHKYYYLNHTQWLNQYRQTTRNYFESVVWSMADLYETSSTTRCQLLQRVSQHDPHTIVLDQLLEHVYLVFQWKRCLECFQSYTKWNLAVRRNYSCLSHCMVVP